MSLRLKNESTTFPPGGLQFHERQLGWKNWISDPNTVWSWDGLVTAVYNLRNANRARFPKLSLDRNVIRQQISEQNANRIASMAGAETYLAHQPVATGGSAPPLTQGQLVNSQQSAVVVNRVDALARGAASLLDWWVREQGVPVDRALADKRAFICSECPKNNHEGTDAWFTKPVSEWLRKKIETRKELSLNTPHDEKLGICEACLCPLKLAVHQPLEIKLKHLSAESKANLWEKCWVLNETQPS